MMKRLLLFLLISFSVLCSAQNETEGVAEASKYSVEVRQRLNHFFYFFVSSIEQTADSIVLASNDHHIDEYAVHWKIYAVSAAQRSSFLRDPVISSIDMRVFLNQMTDYFKSGIGKDRFEEFTPAALACSKMLEREMKNQVMSLIGETINIAEKSTLVELYVSEHPMRDHYFTRESTVPFFESLLKHDQVKLKKLADNISENIYDMSDICPID